MKMKVYDSFLGWKEDQTEANQKIITELQKLVEGRAPHFTSMVKWGQGSWAHGDEPKVYLHAEDDHVQLGFYHGVDLKDPQGLLSGNAKFVRFVRIYSVEDIDAPALGALIDQVTS